MDIIEQQTLHLSPSEDTVSNAAGKENGTT